MSCISTELAHSITSENEGRHGGQNFTLAVLQASAAALENMTARQAVEAENKNLTIVTPSLAALSTPEAIPASTDCPTEEQQQSRPRTTGLRVRVPGDSNRQRRRKR